MFDIHVPSGPIYMILIVHIKHCWLVKNKAPTITSVLSARSAKNNLGNLPKDDAIFFYGVAETAAMSMNLSFSYPITFYVLTAPYPQISSILDALRI